MCYMRLLLIAIVLAPGLVFPGCNRGPAMGEIRGHVTLDGKPVEDGSIRLIPVDGNAPTGSGPVKAGDFSLRLPLSTYRVEISWPQEPPGGIPKDKFSQAVYTIAELIPERYNKQSELTLEVKKGLNEPRFDLLSK